MWSLGNESGYGAAHDALAAWIRRTDPTRPLHYEGAIFLEWNRDQDVTDVLCPMYPEIADIVRWGEKDQAPEMPLIMCEYSHAMGNSNGCLADYWDAIERLPGLQGGFIWEFWDHGLRQELPDGTVRSSYGGDWGDTHERSELLPRRRGVARPHAEARARRAQVPRVPGAGAGVTGRSATRSRAAREPAGLHRSHLAARPVSRSRSRATSCSTARSGCRRSRRARKRRSTSRAWCRRPGRAKKRG